MMVYGILCLLALCLTVGSTSHGTTEIPELNYNLIDVLLGLANWRRDQLSSDNSTTSSYTESFTEASTSSDPMTTSGDRGRAVPGVDYPNYDSIPSTSFTCSDKPHIPGFYANMDTGCQVFHVCWPRMEEILLCPTGTIFNQAKGKCDSWNKVNCAHSNHYYGVNSIIALSYPQDSGDVQPFLHGSIIAATLQKINYLNSQLVTPSPGESLSAAREEMNGDIRHALSMMPQQFIPKFYDNVTTATSVAEDAPIAESRFGILKELKLQHDHAGIKKIVLVVTKLLTKLMEEMKAKYSHKAIFNVMGDNSEDQLVMALVLFSAELMQKVYSLVGQ